MKYIISSIITGIIVVTGIILGIMPGITISPLQLEILKIFG